MIQTKWFGYRCRAALLAAAAALCGTWAHAQSSIQAVRGAETMQAVANAAAMTEWFDGQDQSPTGGTSPPWSRPRPGMAAAGSQGA